MVEAADDTTAIVTLEAAQVHRCDFLDESPTQKAPGSLTGVLKVALLAGAVL